MPAKPKQKKMNASKKSPPKSSPLRLSKDMPVSKVLQVHPETLRVFAEHDLGCLGDSAQQSMTVQAWACGHGVKVASFLSRLKAVASGSRSSKPKSCLCKKA